MLGIDIEDAQFGVMDLKIDDQDKIKDNETELESIEE